MLELETLSLGDLSTNCYLAWCPRTYQAIIVDPADSGDFITERILQLQITPTAILLTHGHFDHVLGLLELKLNFDVPIWLHPDDAFLLAKARASAHHWLHRDPGPVPPADQALHTGQVLTIGQEQLTVMATPGHTPGSVCFYNDDYVFTGDTVFAEGVGRTDFAYSNSEQLAESLDQIHQLPPQLIALAGHGEASRVLYLPTADVLNLEIS